MAYCSESDILERFDEEELVELTNDDPNAGGVDSTVIAKAIEDAEAEINGYCAKWYEIPLTPVPDLTKKLCIDIAIYNLFTRRTQFTVPESVRDKYENAIKLLTKVSRQEVLLGADTVTPVASSGRGGVFEADDRVFTRDDLEQY